VIRRGFWLTAGAVTGIYAYRRVSAVGRRLSASLNPAGLNPTGLNPRGLNPARTTREDALTYQARRGALNAARETFRFTRDVREGMELYRTRHPATLSTDHASNETETEPEDGH
jgi:hypothetical protein